MPPISADGAASYKSPLGLGALSIAPGPRCHFRMASDRQSPPTVLLRLVAPLITPGDIPLRPSPLPLLPPPPPPPSRHINPPSPHHYSLPHVRLLAPPPSCLTSPSVRSRSRRPLSPDPSRRTGAGAPTNCRRIASAATPVNRFSVATMPYGTSVPRPSPRRAGLRYMGCP